MHADITGADFTQANLHGSHLNGLDLRLACFDCAIFSHAKLRECNLEFMQLAGVNFAGADLRRTYLTGSTMFQANLRGANLRGAGLADVEWEGVDLRTMRVGGDIVFMLVAAVVLSLIDAAWLMASSAFGFIRLASDHRLSKAAA